jgi:lipopolysaccharide/colanic/teichoic acid biosynthesis glycosyltransferase
MAKRVLDVVLGAVLSIASLPIIIVGAIGVALTFRASPFFVHERVGYLGRKFRIIKLRTLPPNAPRYADKYTIGEIPLPAFPKLLRQLHLDELPQLFLVAIGRMSLVGPRPELAALLPLMPDDLQITRQAFRPGCTGLWQISEDADRLIAEAPEYDRFYARHAGFWLDLYIVVRTVLLFLKPVSRVTLSDVPSWAAPSGLVPPRISIIDLAFDAPVVSVEKVSVA